MLKCSNSSEHVSLPSLMGGRKLARTQDAVRGDYMEVAALLQKSGGKVRLTAQMCLPVPAFRMQPVGTL